MASGQDEMESGYVSMEKEVEHEKDSGYGCWCCWYSDVLILPRTGRRTSALRVQVPNNHILAEKSQL